MGLCAQRGRVVRCAALAQSPGLSLHGPGAGKSGDKEARPLETITAKEMGAQSRCASPPGPHSARVSEAGHQPAMPASQSCGRRVPTLQPGLGQPCCSNPPSEGRAGPGPPPSLLSLPFSHPHPGRSSTGSDKPPWELPPDCTATALLGNRDPWGSIQTCSRALSPFRDHAW